MERWHVSRRRRLLLLLLANEQNRRRFSRKMWVREVLKKRNELGEYHRLVTELMLGDEVNFIKYMRMTPQAFKLLLSMVKPQLEMQTTHWRKPIEAEVRLSLTLRYLATGDLMTSLAFSYRIGFSTTARIIHQTCKVLWKVLAPQYIPLPTTELWHKRSQHFNHRWNFPNCVGALDGKHVHIQAPGNSGSNFYNYKHFHSIILMAVCTADYKFSVVEVGGCGRESDAGYFSTSQLGIALNDGKLHLPPDACLPGGSKMMPYVFVADEGFPLKTYMMRPFPGKELTQLRRIFNYRLSRTRRVIENTFGILAARWRIFRRPICLKPDNVDFAVKAACCLHNFLQQEEPHKYCPPGYVDNEQTNGDIIPGMWRRYESTGLTDGPPLCGNQLSRHAYEVRDQFAMYFISSDGEIPWQYSHI